MPVEQRRADVPPDLARVIMMLLEKDPANRFPSAGVGRRRARHGPHAGVHAQRRHVGRERGAGAGARRRLAAGRISGGRSAVRVLRSRRPTRRGVPPLGSAGGRQVPQEARAVPVRERRDRARVDRRRQRLASASRCSGASTWRSSTRKLWSDGYDWRDVFRQPRDRDLIDVADDVAHVHARDVRSQQAAARMREQRRARISASAHAVAPTAAQLGPRRSATTSRAPRATYGDRIRRAERDRNEILRAARAHAVVRALAHSGRRPLGRRARRQGAKRSRSRSPTRPQRRRGRRRTRIEAEISRLENAANPLDESGSDERVRRLAHLKRQRRAIADVVGRSATRSPRSSRPASSRCRTSSSISFG